ncbi:uncharacterized protein Z518_06403 [Rhinocladiella mackenziei CBS 650.93]|uniref:Uncharacterized protein n=1 Tax=Rhinocladiella mackenziei CBS 650.93 TaxID=1442369 RepID=A0A0D2IQV1_9EURO|nr:uncharacterized protein Z518_06403 [Rhinocladiella mackenziei CBS 650.93]KIX05531.1 hypothetical protein Z518_06403 [Rhinocladiella mackenziei CBS 650.93]
MPDPMDPESSDSDVSVGGGDEYRFASPLTAPIPLPPPPSKQALESSDALQARLDELQRVEEHNFKKYDLLKAKRARKDEKIRRKREIQDKKWAAIIDARQRRDARIEARRKREDAAFSQFFDHELEEEENHLRRRLKRLKRGLPPEESPQPGVRSISSASMSPPGPSLSTLPPPPKRHQVGPPGQPDAINPSQSRPPPSSSLPAPSKSTAPGAPYSSYYRDPSSSYSRPFHHSSSYSTTPNTASTTTTTTNGLAQSSQPPTDRPQLNHLGRPASPLSRTIPSTQSPATPAAAASTMPPRQTSSSYDTRPPPTTSSGFASINAPPTSGFATINPRHAVTPPASHAGVPRPGPELEATKAPGHQIVNKSLDNNRFHPYNNSAPNSGSAPSSTSTTKRTPSTTHPYQMSEAFANRHHHCERVDSLNRGIWTSYGVGGTQENPTGPAVEMYLRCNHDGCSRIDWRTVHGLQCHIVKNHDQPKGTIGSLDKALEKYGVPVKEVEDYEREHGRGTAGQLADPKNHKIKIKTKEVLAPGPSPYVRKSTPGSYGIDPQARPAGYRPSPASTESPTMSDGVKHSPLTAMTNGFQKFAPSPSDDDAARKSTPQTATSSPASAFTAIRPDWHHSSAFSQQTPSRIEPEPKRLQGDFGMTDVAVKEQPPSSRPEIPNGQMQPAPPLPVDPKTSRPESSGTLSVVEPSMPITAPEIPAAVRTEPSNPQSTTLPPIPNHTKTEETDKTEPRGDGPAPALHTTPDKDGDVHMTEMTEEVLERKADEKVNGLESEKLPANEGPAQTEDTTEDHSETIIVDGDAGKDANASAARKSSIQSPVMTKTTLPLTPGSARRLSRRSSLARKSADAEAENEKDEKDDKDEKSERDSVRNEPRRSISGRLLRRGRV